MTKKPTSFKYIDLFSGCGGLSLGLESSGGELLLAVERSPMAAETFYHNLVKRLESKEEWESYVKSSLRNQVKHRVAVKELSSVLGEKTIMEHLKNQKPDLVVGGPPCQGFSLAGRRNKADLRNQLPWQFLEVVERTNPKLVVIENVVGMRHKFTEDEGDVFNQLQIALSETGKGYEVQGVEVNALHYGAPQHRPRLMIIGLRRDVAKRKNIEGTNKLWRSSFIDEIDLKTIPKLAPVPTVKRNEIRTVGEAIHDLQSKGISNHKNTGFIHDIQSGFLALDPIIGGIANHVERSHQEKTQKRFRLYQFFKSANIDPRILGIPSGKPTKGEKDQILTMIGKIKFPARASDNTILARNVDELLSLIVELRTKKHSQRVLDWDKPARTVVTVADDYVHPHEARTFTVRELARFQGFPDNFEFRAKETTGGLNRRLDVPQYSQVGNAVSPFLAKAVAKLATKLLA